MNKPELYSIGLRSLPVSDAELGIEFPVLLMYPANSNNQDVRLGPYLTQGQYDVPIAAGDFPLVVISHGTGGTHLGYLGIAESLVAQGFVVAMPEHFKNNRNDNSWDNTDENLKTRPRHVSLLIDRLLADVRLKTSLRSNAIALIGHSMGGYTVLAAVGGLPWNQARQQVKVASDSRISAVVLLAPATLWFTPEDALKQVNVPILMFTGEKDNFTPEQHGRLVVNNLPKQTLINHKIIKNAGHFSFMSPFPAAMQHPSFLPSTDPLGFDRAAFHRVLKVEINDFLKHNLPR